MFLPLNGKKLENNCFNKRNTTLLTYMKTNVDIIIVDNAIDYKIYSIAVRTIETLLQSELENIVFHIFVVEGNPSVTYQKMSDSITMIYPQAEFGYNTYHNIGRKHGSSKYVCLCHNDLWFKKRWCSNIIKQMEKEPDLLSASPYSVNPHSYFVKLLPIVQYGNEKLYHISRWCIFQQREMYDIIGDLDERFIYWYCDEDYALTLKRYGIKHALITNSIVNHMESTAINAMRTDKINENTHKQRQLFELKWNSSSILCL